jgi:ribosomal protein S18 acetylase RimI-like enzyme
MPNVAYGAYTDGDLKQIVQLWNEAFGGMRNFIKMDAAGLQCRIFKQENAVEVFDPKGFIVAKVDGKAAGFIHAGVRNETFCKTAYNDWPGGTEGFIGIVAVAPAHRRKGIGTELMSRAKKYLYGSTRIILDGQCLNPFYGNSEGPMSPPWGTTEGISVPVGDRATKNFFGKFGFIKRYTGISLELGLSAYQQKKPELPSGYTQALDKEKMPVVGAPNTMSIPNAKKFTFDAFSVLKGSKVVAAGTSYPMSELPGNKEAIYEIKVADGHREKGLGKFLLASLLESMKTRGAKVCEVLTVVELSPEGVTFYESAGFKEVARWDIY